MSQSGSKNVPIYITVAGYRLLGAGYPKHPEAYSYLLVTTFN
ncbi:MAG TPA: hypothetical protein VF346_09045 [Bacteroidales bacterium]